MGIRNTLRTYSSHGRATNAIPGRELLDTALKLLALVDEVGQGRELKVKQLSDLAVLVLLRLRPVGGESEAR